MSTTKENLWSAASLFEETHNILIFGIEAIGIPKLRSVAAMSWLPTACFSKTSHSLNLFEIVWGFEIYLKHRGWSLQFVLAVFDLLRSCCCFVARSVWYNKLGHAFSRYNHMLWHSRWLEIVNVEVSKLHRNFISTNFLQILMGCCKPNHPKTVQIETRCWVWRTI